MSPAGNHMIKKQYSIYLDTSIPSAYYDSRDKSRQKVTRGFWKTLDSYKVFISELVIEELSAVTDKVLSIKLSDLVKRFHVLNIGEFEMQLAKEYVEAEAIPSRALTDALHLAVASVNDVDIFLSWNFKHSQY